MRSLGSLSGDLSSWASAVSWNGAVIVGDASVPGALEAFRWTEEGMVGLGYLPGDDKASAAHGVSGDGSVVVGLSRGSNTPDRAFRWTAPTGMVPLGVLPEGQDISGARAVSADGRVIVGFAYNAMTRSEAFRWTEQEGMVGLGDLPGSSFRSHATAVSADGSVIVGSGQGELGPEAFRWTEADGMVGLGFLRTPYSKGYALSADGSVVVGEAIDGGNGHRPFIWTAAEGMRDLQALLQDDLGLDLGEFVLLTGATGISADGRTIVGWGSTRHGQIEAWLAHLGPGCRADFDRDDAVDTRDVSAYLNAWVQQSLLADWNYDAVVDTRDFIAFLNAWTEGCD